jgi:spore maturation protein CgeB
MIKVLFCGVKNEYGKPAAGPSFEYKNLYGALQHMPGVVADYFAFDEILQQAGRNGMNEQLIRKVEETRPDLLFCFLLTEELKKETIEYITKKTSTKTFNWFADDHWRFHIFSKFWAPLFTAVGTTDSQTVMKYKKLGMNHVVHTQWAINPYLYYPKPVREQDNHYDITFVGQNYSIRQKYLTALEKQGLPVVAYGTGWPTGRIPQEQGAVIWSSSKVNLNFTEGNYDTPKAFAKLAAKLVVKKELGKYKLNIHQAHNNMRSVLSVRRRQIKSRNFEIPGCGGFLITGDADNLSDYYVPDKEIIIFNGTDDLIEKCHYYINHPKERDVIAQAGYQRTIKDHTYEQRFREIFRAMEL